jgi:pimeloyl-ACP methyl ester carboxylesterase
MHEVGSMNRLLAASLALSLTVFLPGCGGSSTSSSAAAPARSAVPADAPGHTNVVPPAPAAGQSRAGQIYSVYISSPTGDTVVFTVFEPTQITGGRKYPLVLEGHGFAGTRQTSASADIKSLLDSGYGVISIDQRGHGETSGTIRVMDPDFEGRNLIAILDWAEARLGWLAYGPSTNGKDSQNLILGSMGGSYGGMYQYLIHNVDPKHRLDAMTPEIAPSDLTYSLFPNSVVKAGWDFLLFGAGNTAGNNLDRLHFDPFVINFFQNALTTNQVNQEARDFFYYHSNAYFCNGRPVAIEVRDLIKDRAGKELERIRHRLLGRDIATRTRLRRQAVGIGTKAEAKQRSRRWQLRPDRLQLRHLANQARPVAQTRVQEALVGQDAPGLIIAGAAEGAMRRHKRVGDRLCLSQQTIHRSHLMHDMFFLLVARAASTGS